MKSGLLLIDKPKDLTSHDVVDRIRKLLGVREVGHAGTLDPLATGLLVCMVGDATKMSQYLMDEEKIYEVGVRLGVTTDSGDITGKVLKEIPAQHITDADVKQYLPQLVGSLALAVPKYSAVKVKGKKLYEYARNEVEVEIPVKEMQIHDVEFKGLQDSCAHFVIRCGKGTYVRAWAERLGELLAVGGTVQWLRRLASGPFNVDKAQTLPDLENMKEDEIGTKLVPLVDVLSHWPALRVIGREEGLLLNGQIPRGVFSQIISSKVTSGIRMVNSQNRLLALLVRDPQKGIKIARVFHALPH